MRMIPTLFNPDMAMSLGNDRKEMTRRLLTAANSLVDGKKVSQNRWEQYDFDFTMAFVGEQPFFKTGFRPAGPYVKNIYSKLDDTFHVIYPAYNPALYQFEGGVGFWVRESFWEHGSWKKTYTGENNSDCSEKYWMRSAGPHPVFVADSPCMPKMPEGYGVGNIWRKKPGIHMPAQLCRFFLQVTEVKIEQIQSISHSDAISEGIQPLLKSLQPTVLSSDQYRDYLAADGLSMVSGINPIDSFRSLWISINGKESWDQNPWVWSYRFKKTQRPEGFLERKKTFPKSNKNIPA